MAFTIVFLFALCFPFVNALAYDAAKVTGHGHNQILDAKGWTPAPTTAPRVPHELLKRQSRTSLRGLGSTVLLADSNTCGFYEDGCKLLVLYIQSCFKPNYVQAIVLRAETGFGWYYCYSIMKCG